MKFLITGTGRCGTLYAAKYLQAIGLDVQHERMGRDGTANWWFGVPWELSPAPKFDKILHIHREPLATISSLTTCGQDHPFWEHIIANSPVQYKEPVLLRAMKHWLYWNTMCELTADLTVSIEDWGPALVTSFFECHDPVPDIPKDTHTWKGQFRAYLWEELNEMDHDLTRLIRAKANRYHYAYPYEAHLDSR